MRIILIFYTTFLYILFNFSIGYEIRNAPKYQRSVKDAEQRKREAVRKHIETWAKGRRAALLAMAKRTQNDLLNDPEFAEEKEGEGGGATAVRKKSSKRRKAVIMTQKQIDKIAAEKHIVEVETEQLARQAELKHEYDNLQNGT